MLLNDTRLVEADRLTVKGYKVHRSDRRNRAGGVAILVRCSIPHVTTDLPRTNMETIAIRLQNDVRIIAIYNRPRNRVLTNELARLLTTGRKCLLVGDLNANHPDWNCANANRAGNTLRALCVNNDYHIRYPDSPTHFPTNLRTPSTIDLVVSNGIPNINGPTALCDLDSDHNPIVFELEGQRSAKDPRMRLDYSHVNWHSFRRELDKRLGPQPDQFIRTPDQLDQEVETLSAAIQQTIRRVIPVLRQDRVDDLPTDITDKIRLRNSIRRQWQRSRSAGDRARLNQITREIRQDVTDYKNRIWNEKLSKFKINDKNIWKLVRSFKKQKETIPALRTDATVALSNSEIAETLSTHFAAVHSQDNDYTTKQLEVIEDVRNYLSQPPTSFPITYAPSELVKSIIHKLPNNKAPGDDGITNLILKNLSTKAIDQTTKIINASLHLCHFPSAWKIAKVIPIKKGGKTPDLADSYRPISLLASLGKLTEKVFLSKFTPYTERIIDEQFGLRKGHSTTAQLTRVVTDIINNFNKKFVTEALLLDISKAFDKVWHAGLLYKLIKHDIPSSYVRWIHSYLTDRTEFVSANGSHSAKRDIQTGVPQGSVLGPILFLFILNDIPRDPRCSIALFADDTLIYAHSADATMAQLYIRMYWRRLDAFFKHWRIAINADKTESITFTRRSRITRLTRPPQCLTIDGRNVPHKSSVKYLGVTLDTKLIFRNHVDHAVQKAGRALGSLFPLLARGSRMTSTNKLLLYKQTIRPILTYAAPAWCGVAKTTLSQMQTIQNKCLRLALSRARHTRLTDLHEEAGVVPIRELTDELGINFFNSCASSNNILVAQLATQQQEINATYKHHSDT